MIVSFGYKKSGPPPNTDMLFDVQHLTHDVHSPEFLRKFQDIVEYGRSHPKDSIAIGCEKGEHRSVVLANKAATALHTSVYHKDRR